MDKVFLRKQFLQHKDLLKALNSSSNVAKTVSKSSDPELNLILKILHLVGDGEISLLKKHSEIIKNSKKSKKLAEIGSRIYFKDLMKQTRAVKLNVIRLFYSILPAIIESLFE